MGHYDSFYEINNFYHWGWTDAKEGKEINNILAAKDPQYMEGYNTYLKVSNGV